MTKLLIIISSLIFTANLNAQLFPGIDLRPVQQNCVLGFQQTMNTLSILVIENSDESYDIEVRSPLGQLIAKVERTFYVNKEQTILIVESNSLILDAEKIEDIDHNKSIWLFNTLKVNYGNGFINSLERYSPEQICTMQSNN